MLETTNRIDAVMRPVAMKDCMIDSVLGIAAQQTAHMHVCAHWRMKQRPK